MVLGSARPADAAAISGAIYESFNYAAGTLFPNPSTLNGGYGWNATGNVSAANDASAVWGSANNGGAAAGTFRTATAGGLTYSAPGYTNGSPAGNKLTLDAASPPNATQNIGRAFPQLIDAGTTYFSALVSRNTVDTIRTFNIAFMNGTAEQMAFGQIGTAGGNTGGNLALLMNNQNPAGLVNGTTPIAMGNSTTHLVIIKIEWDAGPVNSGNASLTNEIVTMWVDPASVVSEAAAGPAYATTNGFNLTGITGIRPFAGNNATITGFTATAVSANFDEIRFGGSWTSVTSASPVPEPSSVVLVGLMGLVLGAFRVKK
jgi:hypothetical protein